MRLVIILLCMGAVAGLLFLVLSNWLAGRARRTGPWRVDTVTRPDGALAVIVVRERSDQEHTVRELPAGMDSVELACELRLARQDARLQADELNGPA